MSFAKISSWDDVYENFYINQSVFIGAERCRFDEYIASLYGQCWTLLPESDAMWRIYSSYSEGNIADVAIKVRCDSEAYYAALSSVFGQKVESGVVSYLNDQQIGEWVEKRNIHTKADFEKSIIPSLFIKRPPFEHESEYRYTILNNDGCDMLSFHLELLDLFDEYVIDPRLNHCDMQTVVSMLRDVGVSEKQISQSTLYSYQEKVSVYAATMDQLQIISKLISDEKNDTIRDCSII